VAPVIKYRLPVKSGISEALQFSGNVKTFGTITPLFLFKSGAEGSRTPDPLHAMQVRYQLRYSPAVSSKRETLSN
jgi:hypothetical protein